MTETEAKEIAQRFVDQNPGEFVLSIQGARKAKSHPGVWSVIFEVRDKSGNIIDGPMVIDVDERTGEATAFA